MRKKKQELEKNYEDLGSQLKRQYEERYQEELKKLNKDSKKLNKDAIVAKAITLFLNNLGGDDFIQNQGDHQRRVVEIWLDRYSEYIDATNYTPKRNSDEMEGSLPGSNSSKKSKQDGGDPTTEGTVHHTIPIVTQPEEEGKAEEAEEEEEDE